MNATLETPPSETYCSLEIEAIQRDPFALAIARALLVANRSAVEAGMVLENCLIDIEDKASDDERIWCISYIPRNYISRRGGDLEVRVDQRTGEVKEVVYGQ